MGGKSGGIVKLELGCGTSCRSVQYFDIFEDKTSEPFFNAGGAADFIDPEHNLIGYSALTTTKPQKQILIVQDIFDKQILYKEIDMNFANVMTPIENMIFLNEKQIYIEYLVPNPNKPNDYNTKTEIVDLTI